MSFEDCLDRAVKDQKVSQKKADEAKEAYRRAYKEHIAAGLDEFEADARASTDATDKLSRATSEAKYRKMKDLQTSYRLMQAYEKAQKLSPAERAMAMVEGHAQWRGPDLVSRYQTRLGQYHSIMGELIDKYRPRYAGIYKPVRNLNNLVNELYGVKTGDESAAELAKIVKDATNKIIDYANAAGANVEKNPLWRLPQNHSRPKLRNNRVNWINDHAEWLDWDAMRRENGDKILPEERQKYLEESFKTLDTDGMNKIVPGSPNENIASRISGRRKLIYKDAESWIEANKKYGDGNAFDQIIGWVDQMARTTAIMDIFGTNPTSMKSYIEQMVQRESAEMQTSMDKVRGKSPTAKARDALVRFDEVWDSFMLGNRNSDENMFAATMSTTRSFLSSVLLSGAAPLAVMGDTFNAVRVSMFNKLPANEFLGNYAKLALSNNTRQQAIRSGLIAESAVSRMMSSQRVFGVNEGAKWARYINDVSLRATLMTPHTQIAKWAYGMELMGAFADNVKTKFKDLEFKDMLERHGIGEAEWDILRTTKIYDESKTHILRPNDIRDRTDIPSQQAEQVADMFMDMIMYEKRQAIIEASHRARTFLTGNTAAGTLSGEVLRSFSYLKSFVTTITFALASETSVRASVPGKMGHIVGYFLTMATGGALILQLQQIANGKDPLDMTDPKFLLASVLKGGGLGYLGDFLYSDVNEYGRGLENMIAGAPVSFIGDLRNLTVGNAVELLTGKDTNFAKELASFSAGHIPGSKFWLWKTAFQRNVSDQLLKATDPNAYERFSRLEARARKDFNQEYWWRPGEAEPVRGPDWSAMWQTED